MYSDIVYFTVHNLVQYSTVQYSTSQYDTVVYSTATHWKFHSIDRKCIEYHLHQLIIELTLSRSNHCLVRTYSAIM